MAAPQLDAARGDTVQRIYETLREMIIDGHYGPGVRLTQLELAEELGVGRTPLREALRLLEANGFVVSNANRGVVVTPVHVSSAEDLYALRLLVEPPLLAALADQFDDAELDDMDRHIQQMAAEDVGTRGFQLAHFELHDIALARYGETARAMVQDLYRQVQRVQRRYMSRPRVAADVVGIDRAIVAAFRAHDGERVKRLMQLHLIDWAVGLILDVDPDHQFRLLLVAARGLGIDIAAHDDGRLSAPVAVTWHVPFDVDLPATSVLTPRTDAPLRAPPKARRSARRSAAAKPPGGLPEATDVEPAVDGDHRSRHRRGLRS